MKNFDDIQDDDICIIGNSGNTVSPQRKPKWPRWLLWTIGVAVWLILALVIFFVVKGGRHMEQVSANMVTASESEPVAPTEVESEPAVVYGSDTIINDVPLRILVPVNARPELMIGIPDTNDRTIILAAQAADIRADNEQIVGSFVLKGEMLSRGQAKQGFCAIIDGNIFIGVAENTPLLEETTEKDGYFFRQYPLVDNGRMVENKPKGKALRHALCDLGGQIVVVSSHAKESFHDFAQALEDLGVRNAIYLVGSQGYGFCRQSPDSVDSWGAPDEQRRFENVNFILWRAE